MLSQLFDPRIKLRHISCMIEVTRQGGVAAAGQVLGMSQPAVSKSVAELERILAVKLFDRSGRALQLTREGEVFAQYAIGAATALREGIEKIDTAKIGRNSVRIGAMSSVEGTLIPRAVASFLRGPMACNVTIETSSAAQLLNMLRDGHLDFYAGRLANPEHMEGLVFDKLYSDCVVLVVRADHPLTRKIDVSYQDVVQNTLVLPPRNAIGRQIIDGVLIAAGVGDPIREVQTLSNEIGRRFTQDTDAVWAIAHSVVAEDIAAGQFVQLPLDTSNSQGAVGFIRRADDRLSVASSAMIKAIRQEAAAMQTDDMIEGPDLRDRSS